MADRYLGEIRLFTFNFPPKGWALCNGQLLPINQNTALFALLGTTYGGDGRANFALPNLQGRVPLHPSSRHTLGERGGEQTHTLTINELTSHTHNILGSGNIAGTKDFYNNTSATTVASTYHKTNNCTMNPQALTNTGGSQPHQNMQPFLVLNYCIALQGIFPSRT